MDGQIDRHYVTNINCSDTVHGVWSYKNMWVVCELIVLFTQPQ